VEQGDLELSFILLTIR